MAAKVDKKHETRLFCPILGDYFKKNIVFMRLFRERMYFCRTLLTMKYKGL